MYYESQSTCKIKLLLHIMYMNLGIDWGTEIFPGRGRGNVHPGRGRGRGCLAGDCKPVAKFLQRYIHIACAVIRYAYFMNVHSRELEIFERDE